VSLSHCAGECLCLSRSVSLSHIVCRIVSLSHCAGVSLSHIHSVGIHTFLNPALISAKPASNRPFTSDTSLLMSVKDSRTVLSIAVTLEVIDI